MQGRKKKENQTHMTDKAIFVPLFTESTQDLLILDGLLASGTFGLVQTDVARLAVWPTVLNDKRLG